jgi:RNA polymerase sigma-70 factor, ECF subfamily
MKDLEALTETREDECLVQEILSENKEAFARLIRKHNRQFYRIARSYNISDEDSQDVVQQAYIKIYTSLHTFKGNSRLSTWMVRILINECLLHHREATRINTLRDLFGASADGEAQTPNQQLELKEMNRIFEDAMMGMPENLRVVYVMREMENLSVKETADVLSISEQNVKVRLHRAKEHLKEHFLKNFKEANLWGFDGEKCDRIVANVLSLLSSEQIKA